jgi:hypothetical protein
MVIIVGIERDIESISYIRSIAPIPTPKRIPEIVIIISVIVTDINGRIMMPKKSSIG